MTRAFTTQDMANVLSDTVAVMATGSFNLIGAGAYMYAVGVYVDSVKAETVTSTLHNACLALGYGKSSKYELANAAIDVAKAMVKDYGRPGGLESNGFWTDILDAATPADAIALILNYTKVKFGADTVRDLYTSIKGGASAPKAQATKPVADKVSKALEGASGDELASIAAGMVSLVKPSDAKSLLLNLASKLTLDELHEVMAHLADMATVKMGEVAEKKAA